LEDFATSVDAYIYVRDIPLKFAGWVRPDPEGGWIHCPLPNSQEEANAAGMRMNYKYGKKFCILLAEQFTDTAREWWITTGRNMDINCWRPSKPGLCPPDIVETPMLHVLEKQFQNARTQEAAMLTLETLKWNLAEESVAAFRTRCTSLFVKAGIRDFQAKRSFVMGILSDEMCRQIMRPVDEADMWLKIEEAVSTEESIKARNKKAGQLGRYSNEAKNRESKKEMKDLICYNCQKKGHISPNCPENTTKDKDKKGKRKEYSRSDSRSDYSRTEEDTCYNCGGKGHRSPECPSKKRERKRFEKQASNLQMDTREQSPQFYYQAPASSSQAQSPSSSNDHLGSYYYSAETTTEFYAFESLPWYDAMAESDQHWHQEETSLHQLSQNYYDENKYGVNDGHTTAFYAQEEVTPQFTVNQVSMPDTHVSYGDLFEAVGRVSAGPPVPPPRGSMRTYAYTLDDRKMLTVGDTGTAINLVPKGVLEPCGFKITRQPDQKLLTTDGITISPIGICDEFIFKLGGVQFTIKTYVCERAAFQLLLGNHFWWSVGAALFPRLGKIIITRPALRIITATCDILAPESRPPPLVNQRSGPPARAQSLSHKTEVDPLSGEELLENPPPDFHYMDVRPLKAPENITTTSFLKISNYPDVITVGERDYIKEADEDGDPPASELKGSPPDIITDSFIKERIDINPAAPNWFKERIVAIILKYHLAVSWSDDDLGKVVDVPHEIRLKEGSVPVRQPSRRHLYLPKNEQVIKKKAEAYVKLGIWRQCKFSPWLTQLVIAKKGRVCHDFTSLNAATVLDAFPIHSIPDIVSAQSGMGTWSMMDTDRGYSQIIMALLCIFMTAFEMLHQMWESLRMLFGMTGAPATFHRNMAIMMEPVIEKYKEFVNWFFDDIIVGTKLKDWGLHADVVESVMKAARNKGWKFGAHKMRFGYNKLRLLGIIMTPQGRCPDPEKQDTLLTMRIPRTASEMKSFLGLTQWFSEHIPALSWNTTSLRQLLTEASPKSNLRWTPQALSQFEYIKKQMRQPCTLAVYNPKAVVILYTDACAEGLGCMLVQLQEDRSEVVVAFGSCSLSRAQQMYHITRQEALAFIWTLGHFHLYLCAKPFLWRTDHRALKFIFDASKTTIPALQRYKLIADDYRFSTEWIPGARMIADTMSRLCIVPAERSCTMTTREMLTVDLSTLVGSKKEEVLVLETDVRKTRLYLAEEGDIAFYNMMDEEELVMENELEQEQEGNLERERREEREELREEIGEEGSEDGGEGMEGEEEMNSQRQPIHPDEEAIRGKLAIDIPSYTTTERRLLGALSHLRNYLSDPTTITNIPEDLHSYVKKISKTCKLIDDKVMKIKVRGGIKEIPESLTKVGEILKEAHDGGGHRGLDATMSIITARYWIPVVEKVVLRHIMKCATCQKYAKANKFYNPNYGVQSYDLFKH
jgi:hypothetical protein